MWSCVCFKRLKWSEFVNPVELLRRTLCLTGVLIACYLVYTLRISPSEAVQYVRIKRPRSIQTRAQISLVFEFARLLGTQLAQYPDVSLRHGAHFTLQLHLHRQALLLHGQEARTLRHIPKVKASAARLVQILSTFKKQSTNPFSTDMSFHISC